MFQKPISISFAPNFQKDDVSLALKLLSGTFDATTLSKAHQQLKSDLEDKFPGQQAFLFSSGRASLQYALKALELQEGDEVLLQAFTCVAVPNAVLWANLTPVFVDADATYNIDIKDLEKKISPKTRAIIVQHTFGIPANMEEIMQIAKKHNLSVVEDCAHALGVTYKNKKLGEWGDVAIFSFGRDKIISSVFGGAAISKNAKIQERLDNFEKKLAPAPRFFASQQLLYLIIYAISLPLYSMFVGKVFLRASRLLGLLSPAVFAIERNGQKPDFIDSHMPESLCIIACHQLKKLDSFTDHRTKLSDFYIKKLNLNLEPLSYLRMPIIVDNKKEFLKKAQQHNLHLGNWYRGPIDPPNSNLENLNYNACPRAEELAQHTINLPTHINTTLQDAEKIVTFVLQEANGK